MDKKVLITIIIAVAVAVVAIGGVFTWQYFKVNNPPVLQTDQTAGPAQSGVEGWKTYTNNDYGFEIKYPNVISLAQPVSADTNIGLLTLPFEDKFGMYPIWLYVAEKTDNVLDDIDAVNESTDIEKTKETINGVDWNKIEADAIPVNGQGMAQSVTTFYTEKSGKDYFLKCIDCNTSMFGDEAVDLNNIFGQMVSNFKFTK